MDVLADTTPFVDGLGQLSGILPPWVAADGKEAGARVPARSRDPRSACGRSATATGASSTRASGTACACRRASSTPSGTASRSPRSPTSRKADPWDCYFDVLADAGDAYESVLVVGRLFTDEHMAEMISHPLFCLGVDTFTVTEDGPLADVLRHPLGYSGHVHYLTHHVRENGTLRLEEAIRKMTSMPAAHFGLWDRGLLRAGYAADVVVFDYDGLDEVSTVDDPHHYARGRRARARQRRRRRRRRRAHRCAPRDAICCEHSAAMIDLRSDVCSVPTDAMWEAMRRGRARLGDSSARTHPSTRSASASPRCSGRRPRLAADLRDGEPRRDAHVLRAGREGRARGRLARAHARSRWGSPRSRGSSQLPLWAPDGRMDPAAVEELVAESHAALLDPREHPHPCRRHDALRRADRRARRRPRSGTTAACTSTAPGCSTRPSRSASRSPTSRRPRTRS